ncbi:hypothetical protein CONCODRAFT_9508 [Conidiobolus coronatus NRRL 28638]|uniref:F-box domain-containing protein n=1 Tax=Conidiobolus coronatus (strain ATCC 28846 / CBS 209.66 / NRRL 28638) TaxID=796925 RepID=A0A137P000_CONC2|nr:hypothetical protein CONCODRAFT_9508 [Conidiobolus coronatus NRRL 28638]|eukprot:KXN68278.1 hypothetical protein CONCODRAFT_9508 [Conidiobolus coronatus NRRL 28638]
MDTKQPNEDQAISWEYFPDTDTLIRYLNRKDLVELSKCNRFYRKQLEREVLKNIDINTWIDSNKDIIRELDEVDCSKEILEFLKADLGTKLKFAKKCNLDCDLVFDDEDSFGDSFGDIFVKLLPNIKTIRYSCCEYPLYSWDQYPCSWRQSLVTIFSHLSHLEHIEMDYNYEDGLLYIPKKQIFSKSLKSLIINFQNIPYDYHINGDYFEIYETVDASYVNLSAITIFSNKMLQNLSSGMPNLQEVEIRKYLSLDKLILLAFLKSNPQLRKLKFFPVNCNEILKILLSSKYLQYLSIYQLNLEEAEVNSLPSNHSIKYLEIDYYPSASLSLKIINACKSLQTLYLRYYTCLKSLEWSKFERRIDILKLPFDKYSLNIIKEIDASRVFNNIHIESRYNLDENDIKQYIDEINSLKLSNYKFITLTAKTFILKLINKTS